jgi:hypothetical protein
MQNFLKNLFGSTQTTYERGDAHQRVFDAAKRIVFQMPPRGSMLHSTITSKGPKLERQARFELAAYLFHAVNFWCQVGNGSDKRSCRALPGAFSQLIQSPDWFGSLCSQAELQELLADRDHLYFEAYNAGEAAMICQVLTAVLSYATNRGEGLILFHDRSPFDPKEIIIEALTDGVHFGALLEATEMIPLFLELTIKLTDALNHSYRN